MNSAAPARRAARAIDSSDASGSAKAMLDAIESREEERVLEHDPDRLAKLSQAQVLHVDAVDEHRAGVDVVEARDEPGDGGLAAAGGPHQRHGLAGRHGEVELVEHHRELGGVREPHAVEAHLASAAGRPVGGQRQPVGVVADHRVGDEDLVHPLGGGRRALALGDDHPEHPQRPDQHHDVDVEPDQLAEAEVAVEHLMAAVAEHGDEPDVREQLEGRQEGGPHAGRLHRAVEHVVGLFAEARRLHRFGAEALHHPHARHRLLHHRRQLGGLLLDPHHRGVQASSRSAWRGR